MPPSGVKRIVEVACDLSPGSRQGRQPRLRSPGRAAGGLPRRGLRRSRLLLGLAVTLAVGVATGTAESPAPGTEDRVIATVLGTEIRASQSRQLGGLVLSRLLDRFRRQRDIEATQEEIDLFIARSEEQRAQTEEGWRTRRTQLRRRLDVEGLDPEERQRLGSELEVLEQLLAPDPEMERWEAENSEPSRAIQQEVARRAIEAWKTNKALHDRYRGRVIFQQAGPEPLDAYRRFLEEQAAAGSFEILDPAYEDEFWRYFVDERMHAFYDGDGSEILATPWWLLDRPRGEP